MNEDQKKLNRIKKLGSFTEDSDFANFSEKIEATEKLESLVESTQEVARSVKEIKIPERKEFPSEMVMNLKGISLATIKGEKGDKGDPGEKGDSITGPMGPQGEQGPIGLQGLAGLNGKDGKSIVGPQGPAGLNGKDGKDGKSLNKTEVISTILDEIKTAKGENRIPLSAIKDSEFLTKLGSMNGGKLDMSDQRWHGGGLSNITGYIEQGSNVTITGSGTEDSPYIINSTGTIAGSLSATQIAYGSATDTITGSNNLTYDGSTFTVRSNTYFRDISPELITTTSLGYFVTSYDSTASGGGAQNVFRRASGTEATPLAITSGMGLGSFSFRGHTGSAFTASKGFFNVMAAENWSPTANGTYMQWAITPIGSTTLNYAMTLASTGYLGIGTSSPSSILHTVATTETDMASRIINDTYSTGQLSGMIGRRARGTPASPTAVQSGDYLIAIAGRGYGATTFGSVSTGSFNLQATENFTDSAKGTKATIRTTDNGSTTQSDKVTVLGNGNVGIGITSPVYILDVNDTSRFTISEGSVIPVPAGSSANAFLIRNTDTTNGNTLGFKFVGTTVSYAAIEVVFKTRTASAEDGILAFTTIGGGTRAERMRITETGNVGIGTSSPTSTLHTAGSFAGAYVAKTANYTLTASDYTVNCTANSFDITLPTAVGITGRIYNIKNSGTGIITINTTSSQTIDGNASGVLILNQYDNLTVQSDGANFIIL